LFGVAWPVSAVFRPHLFYRPDLRTRYKHIDSLFGDNAIDWDLLEKPAHKKGAIAGRGHRPAARTPLNASRRPGLAGG
jgi:hypothetical protein